MPGIIQSRITIAGILWAREYRRLGLPGKGLLFWCVRDTRKSDQMCNRTFALDLGCLKQRQILGVQVPVHMSKSNGKKDAHPLFLHTPKPKVHRRVLLNHTKAK